MFPFDLENLSMNFNSENENEYGSVELPEIFFYEDNDKFEKNNFNIDIKNFGYDEYNEKDIFLVKNSETENNNLKEIRLKEAKKNKNTIKFLEGINIFKENEIHKISVSNIPTEKFDRKFFLRKRQNLKQYTEILAEEKSIPSEESSLSSLFEGKQNPKKKRSKKK